VRWDDLKTADLNERLRQLVIYIDALHKAGQHDVKVHYELREAIEEMKKLIKTGVELKWIEMKWVKNALVAIVGKRNR